jgi:hypothetical protein
MKSENICKTAAMSSKFSAATDYSSEHKAWQQRVEKEMHNQN